MTLHDLDLGPWSVPGPANNTSVRVLGFHFGASLHANPSTCRAAPFPIKKRPLHSHPWPV